MSHTRFPIDIRALPARVTVAIALSAAIMLSAPLVASAAAVPTVELGISKFAFAPQEISIAPGTKVVWTNHDETPHSVASSDKSFASKGLDTNDTFEHIFDHEGDFKYVCTVHPFMTGVVHVHKK